MRDTSIQSRLQLLGLNKDEAAIFLCLSTGPKNQLGISRETGIARSNVYRIVDKLAEKGLVHGVTTFADKQLISARPENLEQLVVKQEELAESQRNGFIQVLPLLASLENRDDSFAVETYAGIGGLKQMLWNELGSSGEILCFSCGSLNSATGSWWAEKFRAEIISRGIKQRGLENAVSNHITTSLHGAYSDHYQIRFISEVILTIKPEITIHDDTISIYNSWTDDNQLGTEIKNPYLAAFMRQMFEHYWQLAK
jgi:DNA-binding MarR family transcriptional regulator